ncbi:MAG: DUF2304 domain-containing protein [Thermodesulfobacteriota bacterium]
MMTIRLNLFAIIGSIILLLVILELIRRKYLQERYSLIWVVTGILFLLLSIRVDILYRISNFLGFSIPSNALFFFGVLFLILIVLGLSVITSRLSVKNKILAQEVVLLKKRVEDLEKRPQSSQ